MKTLAQRNQELTIVLILSILLNALLIWGLANKYEDNEYLAAELNKTQGEKAELLSKNTLYEDAKGK